MSAGIEKRATPRLALRTAVRVAFSGEEFTGTVEDISVTGARLEVDTSKFPFPQRADAGWVSLPDLGIASLACRIVRRFSTSSKAGLAVRFLDEDRRPELGRKLAEVLG
jgi:hypothetical protein